MLGLFDAAVLSYVYMTMILKLLLNAFVVFLASYILQGVEVDNFVTAIIVAVVLGILNIFLKPILVILTLPINILTLGLFTLVINTLLVLLASSIVPGFEVLSFWWALGFSLIVSVISSFLGNMESK
jgi:putative membrane protein